MPVEAIVERPFVAGTARAPRGTARSRRMRAQLHVEQFRRHGSACATADGLRDKRGTWRGANAFEPAALGARFRACRRAAPGAARSSRTCTASAPIAGGRSNFSATAGARPAECRCRRPTSTPARRAWPGRRGSPARAPRSLMTNCRGPRHPPQIRPQGRAREDHGALHGAVGRRSGGERLLVPVPLHRTPAVVARVQPVGAGRARVVASGSAIAADPFALRRIKRTPPLKGMSAAAAAQGGRGRLPSARRSAVAGQDDHPGRRRADHRQHGRGLRAGA